MSDKYPHQSNYVYCSNNPIRMIDPNGEDEYEFDKQGHLINTITNANEDRVHIIDDDGNRVASSKSFAVGTINKDKNSIPGVLHEGTEKLICCIIVHRVSLMFMMRLIKST